MTGITITSEGAIGLHLSEVSHVGNIKAFSGFRAAIRDARKFTKRDQDTGAKCSEELCGDHGSWLGAIGYLVILDQIGKCFKPIGIAQIMGNSINKALGYFTSLSEADRDAIYSLRCALAHDFSLSNNVSHPNLWHHFSLSQGDTSPVVILPKNSWNGSYSSFDQDNTTYINLEALGDLVEGIHDELIKLASAHRLEITLTGGAEELLRRYSIVAG